MATHSPRPSKRLKTGHIDAHFNISRSISPPPSRKKASSESPPPPAKAERKTALQRPKTIPSPISLTHIRDLPLDQNVDAVKLTDILGDPMIKECWQFNYLFDVGWLVSQFDEDVRSIVQLKIVHGSWRREDTNKIRIDEACSRHSNVKAITAYMPEPFGTHHSKMMIIFRHDDFAQIIIHTANMIPRDWTNMCQALWSSPLLPLSPTASSSPATEVPPFGISGRFRRDLLSYLKAYGSKTGELVKELKKYDFSSIRAALIASVPSKQLMHGLDPNEKTTWGWPALRHVLTSVPSAESTEASIVIQISSIATLGATSSYLDRTFFPTISSSSTRSTSKPSYSIIFPTAASIRRSLDGYASGASIHTKIQSAAQSKQLAYLKPYLRHWEIPSDDRLAASTTSDQSTLREAGRRNAAPHIKTYIRFKDKTMESIDWAMVTSANLSTQAWGAAASAEGIVKISSFEIGVIVWPELFSADSGSPREIEMVPMFGKNEPDPAKDTEYMGKGGEEIKTRVGFRMPYDLPLVKYGRDDEPWCATKDYTEPDWMGGVWSVSGY